MRIGLYGLPTAGKSFLLDAINGIDVLAGSKLLRELEPNFDNLSDEEKDNARKKLAQYLMSKDHFIMDGHYAFGDNIVFTEDDGQLYDVFLYLYVEPDLLKKRMSDSIRNKKYMEYDIERWQLNEVEGLRAYCHKNNKDFYVIDNPEKGYFPNINIVVEFINQILTGYSCVEMAKKISAEVCNRFQTEKIVLFDGDKTLIKEDSSMTIGYKTHIFDNNFYTGFQAWRHQRDLLEYLKALDYYGIEDKEYSWTKNEKLIASVEGSGVIISSGLLKVWKELAGEFDMPLYCGDKIAADTKYFVAKFLKESGKYVTACGDSMNDYYMLLAADESYLIAKNDGSISKSLKGKDLRGIKIVYS